MINSVRTLPNHYEALGLTPTATDEEISQAFARKMSECRWDPMGPSARICIAYETLSNRFKRADYDRARGLEPPARPRLSGMTVTQERWAPFIASVPTNALGQAASEAAMSDLTQAEEPEARSGKKPSSFIAAASLRELARPARPGLSSEASPQLLRQQRPQGNLESQIQEILAKRPPERAKPRNFEDGKVDWKRPALAVGGCLVAAAFIGAFAGLSLKDDEGSAHAESPAIVAPVGRQTQTAPATVTPATGEADTNSDQMVVPQRTEPRTRPARSWYARSRYAHSWYSHSRYAHSRAGRRSFETPVADSGAVGGQSGADVANQATAKASVAQPVAAEGPAPR